MVSAPLNLSSLIAGSTYSANDASGIKVTPSQSVSAAFVYYGKSFLNQVTDKLDVYLKFNSILDQRVNNLNDTLATVAEKRSALEGRIESITQRYARQYSAMESTVASFQETGTFLLILNTHIHILWKCIQMN